MSIAYPQHGQTTRRRQTPVPAWAGMSQIATRVPSKLPALTPSQPGRAGRPHRLSAHRRPTRFASSASSGEAQGTLGPARPGGARRPDRVEAADSRPRRGFSRPRTSERRRVAGPRGGPPDLARDGASGVSRTSTLVSILQIPHGGSRARGPSRGGGGRGGDAGRRGAAGMTPTCSIARGAHAARGETTPSRLPPL